MAAAEILLTEDQRLEFTQIPQNISECEIAKYYTFSTYDIDIIINLIKLSINEIRRQNLAG
nr:hypothetical protein [Clostridium sp. AWRP]